MVFCLHTFLFSSQRGFCFDDRTWFLQTPAWGAVWLFFLISGYLIGKGFYTNRYHTNMKGIIDYYLGRFFKVALPTLFFIFMCCILIQPDFVLNNPVFLKKIFTLSYDANPGFDGVSATWYISTLMGLYILAPYMYMLLELISKNMRSLKIKKYIWIALMLITIICGLFLRIFALKQQVDWSSKVYVPFYMNIDIFLCGMILNYIQEELTCQSYAPLLKIISLVSVLGFVLFNCYIYYRGYYIVYQYVLPSVYIIVFGIFIINCDNQIAKSQKLTLRSLTKNPLCIIEWFSDLSFGFYLFHSLILSKIYLLISGSPTIIHLKLLIYAFVLTIPFAYLISLLVKECSGIYKRIKQFIL